MGESFAVTITGHYTDRDGLAAVGVTAYHYQSARPLKRQAELLGIRSALMNFFVREWIAQGGTVDDALYHLSYDSSGYQEIRPERTEAQAP